MSSSIFSDQRRQQNRLAPIVLYCNTNVYSNYNKNLTKNVI